jgi:hypothetical protein
MFVFHPLDISDDCCVCLEIMLLYVGGVSCLIVMII